MNLFAELLAQKGWSFFPFNNRGAHYLKKFTVAQSGEEVLQGTAMEVIRDTVLDIEAAIGFLRKHGYEKFILVGESTGANKICVYHHYLPENTVSGYALIGGGDDTGLFYQQLGKERFWEVLKESQQRVEAGTAREWLSPNLSQPKFAYRALADILDPDGDYNCFPFYEHFIGEKLSTKPLFRYYQEINKPTLVLYGNEDMFCYQPAKEVTQFLADIHPQPQLISSQVIPGAEHSFQDKEREEAEAIVNWLTTTFA